jgi:hypothetical protein
VSQNRKVTINKGFFMDEQTDEQITCQMCGAGGFNSKDELDAHNREAHGDEE